MADLVDKAESDMSQLINKVGTQVASRSGKAAVTLSVNVAKGVANVPYTAAAAMWGAARQAIHDAKDSGRVTLKEFSNLADGRREVVTLDDQAVSRELEKELKRHGVTWASEKQPDGSTTFHVQGKDIELVQHALGVAAQRVDERLVSQRDVQPAVDDVQQYGADDLREDAPDLPQSVVDETPARAGDEPAVDAPEPDGTVVDQGGHTEQRQPAATRAEQAPQVSARDQTRRRNADRIDKKVAEKKAERSTEKTRTKKRTPSRDSSESSRASRRG